MSKPSGAVLSLLRHGRELPDMILEREAVIRAEALSGHDSLDERIRGGVTGSAAEVLLERLETDIVLRRLRQLYGEYLAIMELLSDRQREFVRLRYEQDLSLAEVASRMEISLRGAKWYVSEIFKALAGRAIGAASKAA